MKLENHASQNNAHMRQFIAHGMTAKWVDGVWEYGRQNNRVVEAIQRHLLSFAENVAIVEPDGSLRFESPTPSGMLSEMLKTIEELQFRGLK